MLQTIFLIFALLWILAGCDDSGAYDPCHGVTCDNLGDCYAVDSTPRCDCDDGYHNVGTSCVPDETDGDADADAETDGNGDADGEEELEILEIVVSESCLDRGTAVVFTAVTSGGSVAEYHWDFGDGVTSTQAQPSHFYATVGFYDVSVTVEGPTGRDTLESPRLVRVIRSGWTQIAPVEYLGDINDIWQSPATDNRAFAVGDLGLAEWDGTRWESRAIAGVRHLTDIHGYDWGSSAMFTARSESHEPVVYIHDGSDWIDADPSGHLPTGTSVWFRWPRVVSWGHAYLLVDDDGEVSIWEFNQLDDFSWTHRTPLDGVPAPAEAFTIVSTDTGDFALLATSDTILRSTSLAEDEVIWIDSDTGRWGIDTIIAADKSTHWLAGLNGLLLCARWNEDTETYAYTDHSAEIWSNHLNFIDMAATNDGDILFVVGKEYGPPDKTTIVRIDGATTELPSFSILEMDGENVMTGHDHQAVAAYDETQLWYGTTSGYLARWDGAAWDNINGEPAAGNFGPPIMTPDGYLAVPTTNGNPLQLLLHDGVEWRGIQIPIEQDPSVAWYFADDDIWVIDDIGEAHHLVGSEWVSTDLDLPSDSRIWRLLGPAPEDIWAIGEDNDKPLVMHYNGSTWIRDDEAERILGGPTFVIEGSAGNDVYVSGANGALMHFDGANWSPVEHNLFAVPENFGLCVDSDPGATCSGDGLGFFHLALTDSGNLFASVVGGTLVVQTGEEANCAAGQYRCMLAPDTFATPPTIVLRTGSSWTSSVLPVDAPAGYYTFVGSIWAASDEEAYAIVIIGDGSTLTSQAFTWDGSEWTLMSEQPDGLPLFWLFGRGPGDVHGMTSAEGGSSQILRYQTCPI